MGPPGGSLQRLLGLSTALSSLAGNLILGPQADVGVLSPLAVSKALAHPSQATP